MTPVAETQPKAIRDYVFCPENGVSVAMEYSKSTGEETVEVKLAVTFCQEKVTLSKKEARNRLNERLDDAIFNDHYCSNKYTCKVPYNGKSAKKDLLLPFLRYVTNLLTHYKNVKPLLQSAVQHQKNKKIKFYFNYITAFNTILQQNLGSPSGLSVSQAQALSSCRTAQIKIRGYKELIWVSGYENPMAKVANSEKDKRLVFKPISLKIASRLKKITGWEPVFPNMVVDTVKAKGHPLSALPAGLADLLTQSQKVEAVKQATRKTDAETAACLRKHFKLETEIVLPPGETKAVVVSTTGIEGRQG